MLRLFLVCFIAFSLIGCNEDESVIYTENPILREWKLTGYRLEKPIYELDTIIGSDEVKVDRYLFQKSILDSLALGLIDSCYLEKKLLKVNAKTEVFNSLNNKREVFQKISVFDSDELSLMYFVYSIKSGVVLRKYGHVDAILNRVVQSEDTLFMKELSLALLKDTNLFKPILIPPMPITESTE